MASHPIDYRYGKDVRPIFDEEAWYKFCWRVEGALARVESRLGLFPKDLANIITDAIDTASPQKVREYEKIGDHDLMAMVKALADACLLVDKVDPKLAKEAAGQVHRAATSYDIEDTAQVVRLLEAYNIIRQKAITVRDAFLEKAVNFAKTPCIGRTHGQHAVPITFGFKYANYANDLQKQIANLDHQMARVKGKFSGAVGAYNSFSRLPIDSEWLEELIGEEFDIQMEDISTQVVSRAPYADLIESMASLGGVLEKHALEIRELARPEILEAREPKKDKQVGSSAMPHKRNPIKSENICSLAILLRKNTSAALELIALMHERDLTNSAAERAIFPEQFAYLDEILKNTLYVVTGLEVFPQNMLRNLYLTKGLIMSEEVLTLMADRGMNRQDAHELLRVASLQVEAEGTDLIAKLKTMPEVTNYIPINELDKLKPKCYTGRAAEKTMEIVKKLWSNDRDKIVRIIVPALYERKYTTGTPEALPEGATGFVPFGEKMWQVIKSVPKDGSKSTYNVTEYGVKQNAAS